ncbi:MAG: hypothetical protein ACR2QS_01945 [Woeseiaceae bacterium]
MSEENPIRVFVTHVFEETHDYLRVFEFLESDDRFYYLNVSKPEAIPEQGGIDAIKEELIGQIKASEAIIVLPAVFEQKPDLVNYMMDVAEANDLGVFTIRPFGGLLETPPELEARTGNACEWNARQLIDRLKLEARGEDTQRWEVIDFPGLDDDDSASSEEAEESEES